MMENGLAARPRNDSASEHSTDNPRARHFSTATGLISQPMSCAFANPDSESSFENTVKSRPAPHPKSANHSGASLEKLREAKRLTVLIGVSPTFCHKPSKWLRKS